MIDLTEKDFIQKFKTNKSHERIMRQKTLTEFIKFQIVFSLSATQTTEKYFVRWFMYHTLVNVIS